MPGLLAPMLPALGLAFVSEDVELVATHTVLRGQVVEVDVGHTDQGSTNNDIGSRSSGSARAIAPSSSAAFGGRFTAVALQAVTAGMRFRAMLNGEASVAVFGQFTAGDLLVLQTGGDSINGKRVYGLLLESGGVADMFGFAKVLWSGEKGLSNLIAVIVGGDEPTVPTDDILPLYDPSGTNPGAGELGASGGTIRVRARVEI